ncbi:MAG TPA: hypothetical protein VGN16_23175, partial [Acidobacteriaceae bacterium]
MPATYAKEHVKVADELYLILALLHRENPERESFTIAEIMSRAASEGLGGSRSDQRSLRQHAYEHAAGNVPPGKVGGRYRMVFRDSDNRVRLLRTSDEVHPDRHQKWHPDRSEVPPKYHELLDWAAQWQSSAQSDQEWLPGLHRLR